MDLQSTTSLDRILVASDLSETSDLALQAGASLALASGAELHAFHAVRQPTFPYWQGLVQDHVREAWVADACDDLARQVARVFGEGFQLNSSDVQVGDPTKLVSGQAEKVKADMIIAGPHSPRAAFDNLLGSTADRLIRSASVPCLVAKGPLDTPLSQILLPVDFSAPSNHCVTVAMDLLGKVLLAGKPDAPPAVIELLFVSAFASSLQRPISVRPLLEDLVNLARSRLPPGCEAKILPRILSAALPTDGISAAAERMDADLIVLGTHGYSTLGRAMVGSVASAVARSIPRSTLLVPPP
jgi:nucleotide-binding universal stress UspA family protein